MLSLLKKTEDALASVMLIAHSPGTETLALTLSRKDGTATEEILRERIELKFPTGALACLRFAAEHWRSIEPGTGKLTDFIRPRDLSD